MSRRATPRRALLIGCLALASAGAVEAQELPPYSSMNPMVFSRSGLQTFAFVEPARRWHVTTLMDLASPVEYVADPDLFYVLDAELLRVEVTATRALSKHVFLLAQESFNAANDGFMDGFLEWYHNLIGLQVGARKIRPRNRFAWELDLPDGRHYTWDKSRGYLGDIRLGAGFRHSRHWQTVVSATLPTGTGPEGYGRGTASVNAVTMLRSDFGKRFTYEGSLGFGVTPTHGRLAEFQRSAFVLIAQGLRGRVAGPLALYANVIWHSTVYRNIGTSELDAADLTTDVGGFLKFRGLPEIILGLTEDLKPSSPAIDLSFRVGARW